MGQKDITEKILMDYNDIFSDIINVLLFDGDRRVDPDSLESAGALSQYKADKRVIKHVDEVMKLLAVMTGDDRYEKVLQEEGKEDIQTMCDVAERLEKQGYEKGRKDERILIFKDLVKKGVYTPEQAEKESGISAKELV